MNQTLTHRKISITGDLGSGKSIIGRLLGQKTGFKFYSSGGIQREIASRHGITTLALNKLSEQNHEIDKEIDDFTRDLSQTGESFVIDSRMAWYFIPNSFKIYLQVNVDIAAERILSDKSRKNEDYPDFDSAKEDIIKRKESEIYRFKKYYDVDCENMDNYDLVINTSFSTPEEIIAVILNNLSASIAPACKHKYWYPPMLLYPGKNPKELEQEAAKQLVNAVKEKGYDNCFSVEVRNGDEFLLINDGHKRVSAALFNNISFIPVKILPGNKQKINSRWLSDWENFHHFQFLVRPTK